MGVWWGLLMALGLLGWFQLRSHDHAMKAQERRAAATRRILERTTLDEALVLLATRQPGGHVFLRVRQCGTPYVHYVFVTRSLIRDANSWRAGAILRIRGRKRHLRIGTYLLPRRPDDVTLVKAAAPATARQVALTAIDATCLNDVILTRGRVGQVWKNEHGLTFELADEDGGAIRCLWSADAGDAEREAFLTAIAADSPVVGVYGSVETGRDDYEFLVGQVIL